MGVGATGPGSEARRQHLGAAGAVALHQGIEADLVGVGQRGLCGARSLGRESTKETMAVSTITRAVTPAMAAE